MCNLFINSYPNLVLEWDETKNEGIISLESVKNGSNKVVWWICPTCSSSYDMSVKRRTSGQNCPYCSGYRVNHTNCLSSVNPSIASQWDYERNKELGLTPETILYRSTKKVWWVCDINKEHKWETTLKNRDMGKGCPYCSGRKAFKGETDLFTTNPEMANLLLDKEDGYRLKAYSEIKTNWKCYCGKIIYNRTPRQVSLYGLCCPSCSDGKSYPEKIVGNLLAQNYSGHFETEKIFDWLPKKRYDFYLPTINTVIEVHGEQHYRKAPSFNKPLESIQQVDALKEKLAIENGLSYIEINAMKSELKYLKESIKKSGLLNILEGEIDWKKIHSNSIKPLQYVFLDLFRQGLSVKEIANKMNICDITGYKYLKHCREAGLIQ